MRPKDRERLKKRRRELGLTQRELALLCKCTQAAISGLETGNMLNASKDLATQISRWLQRDVDELFTEHEGASALHRVTNAAGSKRSMEKVPA
ncbi:helix-turn-helix transcriptional regulator [Arthrobacter agilis]|uniref:helix-turn-helix transcriptional regulator n=1 Tax=Arthrobacter agilis TaxID=37921 RepID=UPI0023652638|nr:helix-turn-helix transcriptional regulator [Arthrobacter agilis]WDF32216.1 helix-turn-helix transcriptional regulator [Arthrobacter agilis]